MRQKLVAGNWKMHASREMAEALVGGVTAGLGEAHDYGVAVCPPFPYLEEVGRLLAGTSVSLGAQSLAAADEGAYTGEVSGAMLADLNCRYVIVGHSERRALYGEDDAVVAAKFLAARRHGLLPILCVGETLEERESGVTETVVGRQLEAVVEAAGAGAFGAAVIAYEPVWAIGTGRTASPEQAQEVHAFIRSLIADKDAKIADSIQVLYGGSVKPANAAEIFSMPDVDGGLIGGASLEAESFVAICSACG
jgi:triosephosphate isomerase